MLQHKMEIYGLCSSCLEKRSPLMPLTMAKPGERIAIKDMMGGKTARGRLASMGLRIGDVLEIISNDNQGRLIVGHDCTRLGLGRGIASKIMVSLAPPNQSMECEG
jgi:Fur family ferric uptake transcriptional regulator